MNILKIVDGKVEVSSLVVSELFGREHKNVLVSIDKLVEKGVLLRLDAKPRDYLDIRGKEQRCYNLTERGFLISMPFIGGEKSEEGQIALVDAFLKLKKSEKIELNNDKIIVQNKLKNEKVKYNNLLKRKAKMTIEEFNQHEQDLQYKLLPIPFPFH